MQKYDSPWESEAVLKKLDLSTFEALSMIERNKLALEAQPLGKTYNALYFTIFIRKSVYAMTLEYYRKLDQSLNHEFANVFVGFLKIVKTHMSEKNVDCLVQLLFHLRNDIDEEPIKNGESTEGQNVFMRYVTGTASCAEKFQALEILAYLSTQTTSYINKVVWKDWNVARLEIYDKLPITASENARISAYTDNLGKRKYSCSTTPYSCPVREMRRRTPMRVGLDIQGYFSDLLYNYMHNGLYENLILDQMRSLHEQTESAPHQLPQTPKEHKVERTRDFENEAIRFLDSISV